MRHVLQGTGKGKDAITIREMSLALLLTQNQRKALEVLKHAQKAEVLNLMAPSFYGSQALTLKDWGTLQGNMVSSFGSCLETCQN